MLYCCCCLFCSCCFCCCFCRSCCTCYYCCSSCCYFLLSSFCYCCHWCWSHLSLWSAELFPGKSGTKCVSEGLTVWSTNLTLRPTTCNLMIYHVQPYDLHLFAETSELRIFGQHQADHMVKILLKGKSKIGKGGGWKAQILWSTCPWKLQKNAFLPPKRESYALPMFAKKGK